MIAKRIGSHHFKCGESEFQNISKNYIKRAPQDATYLILATRRMQLIRIEIKRDKIMTIVPFSYIILPDACRIDIIEFNGKIQYDKTI